MFTRKKNHDGIGTQTSFTQQNCRRVLQLVGMACVLFSLAAEAGPWGSDPWVEVGRSSLRSDIQILADAGVIDDRQRAPPARVAPDLVELVVQLIRIGAGGVVPDG